LLRFARNRFLFTYNIRNCQRNDFKSVRNGRNVRNDVKSKLNNNKRDLKISQRNDVKSALKIDDVPSLPRNTLLNPRPAGTATRTLAIGTHCSVT
jgi:hypothetical protein